MFCPNCGCQTAEEAKFCPKCGSQLQTQQKVTKEQIHAETRLIESVKFATSYITFYIKGKVDVYNDQVRLEIPNTILGLIPLGSEKRSINITMISEAKSNFKVRALTLFMGFMLTLLGLLGLMSCIAGSPGYNPIEMLIIFAVGVLLLLNSLQTTISISLASGEQIAIPLVIFEKAKAEQIEAAINNATVCRTHDTNTRYHAERQTDRLIDAINAK